MEEGREEEARRQAGNFDQCLGKGYKESLNLKSNAKFGTYVHSFIRFSKDP